MDGSRLHGSRERGGSALARMPTFGAASALRRIRRRLALLGARYLVRAGVARHGRPRVHVGVATEPDTVTAPKIPAAITQTRQNAARVPAAASPVTSDATRPAATSYPRDERRPDHAARGRGTTLGDLGAVPALEGDDDAVGELARRETAEESGRGEPKRVAQGDSPRSRRVPFARSRSRPEGEHRPRGTAARGRRHLILHGTGACIS